MTIYGAELPYPTAGDRIVDDEEYFRQVQDERREKLFAEAMKGEGKFWDLSRNGWDREQELAAFRILQHAYQLPGASHETRMRLIDAGMKKLFDRYSQSESL